MSPAPVPPNSCHSSPSMEDGMDMPQLKCWLCVLPLYLGKTLLLLIQMGG